jgi:hydrogenase maturation protease
MPIRSSFQWVARRSRCIGQCAKHGAPLLTVSMKTIIIGLGNPILGDDGVGWKVAQEVKEQLHPRLPHAIEFLSLGGISLMEYLVGYERAILIDAIASDRAPGSIILSDLSEMPDYSAFHTTSTHDTSLQNAIKLGKAMGAVLPEQVIVVGITANHVYDFGEELSLPVAGAVSRAAQIVIDLL